MYNIKFIRTKIKNFDIKINIKFQGNKMPEGNECCICLSPILLDSVINIDEKYYPQIYFE